MVFVMARRTDLTAKQTETLRALHAVRLWGMNPAGDAASRPCRVRDWPGLKGKSSALRALETRGFVTVEMTGHGQGACGESMIVTLTEAGLAAARAQ